jgi:hypothetical protein
VRLRQGQERGGFQSLKALGNLIIKAELIEIGRQLLLGILRELCQRCIGEVPSLNGIFGSFKR